MLAISGFFLVSFIAPLDIKINQSDVWGRRHTVTPQHPESPSLRRNMMLVISFSSPLVNGLGVMFGYLLTHFYTFLISTQGNITSKRTRKGFTCVGWSLSVSLLS